jgi:hypothetical protein
VDNTGFELEARAVVEAAAAAGDVLAVEELRQRAIARELMRLVTGPGYDGTDHMMPPARRGR